MKTAGEDRVLMGSDHCFPIAFERRVEIVAANRNLSEAAKRAILAANAHRLLKL